MTLNNPGMPSEFHLVWVVVLLPLAGFLFQALFGKAIERAWGKEKGRMVLGWIGVLPVALAFIVSVYLFFLLRSLPEEERLVISTWFDWLNLQSLRIPYELRIDVLSLTMALIVTGVGFLIHWYATGYMGEDRDYPRFFTYFNLFIVFMLTLVLANNLLLLFIGWEGVGLCSYLLIGYWYEDIENAKAANKAFIVNRIGDWGMTLGIFLIAVVFASNQGVLGPNETRYLSFDVILPKAQEVLFGYSSWIAFGIPILLFVGAMGKSAQFPLYLWLPDAMAGPTPVSALIHAATMVTAGVYLVARCHVFFELAPYSMMVVACVGAFTAIFAATIAFGQTDIKRVLAFSTVSQLGYMFLGTGVGAFSAGMFHLTTHAFFKALLFLGSGAVILAMAHNQDMRNYGNLWKYLPITFFTMMMGWLAISGVPIWAGFFSKDEILGKVYASSTWWGGIVELPLVQICYWIGLITAVLTAGYMTRLFMLTFLGGEERWRKLKPESEHAEVAEHHESVQSGRHHVGSAMGHPEKESDFYLSDEEILRREREEHEEHPILSPNHTPKEVGSSMTIPLIVLAALSLLGGAVLSGLHPLSEVIGLHIPNYFEEWLAPIAEASVLPSEEMFRTAHTTEILLILASVLAALLGIAYHWRRYRNGLPSDERELRGWRYLAQKQWLYDPIMMKFFVHHLGRFAEGFYRWFDVGVIDTVFVNGSAWVVGIFGRVLRRLQTGYARAYAMAMLVGGVILLTYIWWYLTEVFSKGK
ncbi:MAG TPA: NADH-quinone oxidoreductase subunit L [Fimbriimonadales bacterium]|nr:NADH-quinone oxidoreductase subunit L [Fimbriimonadales bacterium]